MDEYDYIVVGSGAGGGTVAARLAENGFRTLLLEAGTDPVHDKGSDQVYDHNRLPQDYHVPVFHAFSTENNAMRWDYFVRHYTDQTQQERDPKYVAEFEGEPVNGILYPRAGCLGGCTSHNAMITVYPANEDWEYLEQLTGDSSWGPVSMNKYWQKLEDCRYRPVYRFLYKLFRFNPTRHGFNGWLGTQKAIPVKAVSTDPGLIESVAWSAFKAFSSLRNPLKRILWFIQGAGDPNDWRLIKDNAFGLHYPPLATHDRLRNGTRERVLDIQKRFPQFLTIEMQAHVTKVILDDDKRAVGVEYLKGNRLYKAFQPPSGAQGELKTVHCKREVILSGGAFNTPQLLMLSGIGDSAELAKHHIECKVHLPGVGKNLQDRYEVGVVNRMCRQWEVLDGAKYDTSDPQYQQWLNKRGVYTTNGAVIAAIIKSKAFQKAKGMPPDLFCFALLALFRGYFPTYSRLIAEHLDYLTWAVLKGHTKNRGGDVTLNSADPLERPYINFRYFEEGTDQDGEDLDAVVEGVKFVRSLTKELIKEGVIEEEELPGKDVQTDDEIKTFIRNRAWGHHASCTCPIGTDDDPMAVLDKDFNVRGVSGLRVVDACVFPRIPGLFIVSAIYMIAEKAADVIIQTNPK